MPLTLSRYEGQKIIVGEAVVTVTRVEGRRVVLSVEAPPDVPIRRAELAPRGEDEPPQTARKEGG